MTTSKRMAVTLAILALAAWSAPAVAIERLSGSVSSGSGTSKTPIAGALVTVFQAQDGPPRVLATASSDRDGAFSVSLNPDPQGGILYAVARKGSQIELTTLLGIEAQVPGTFVINEMTTVASAYATARLLRDGVLPGKPLLPMRIAVEMSRNLVSPVTGLPSSVITSPPNARETNTWASLGTLSNLLVPCARGLAIGCSRLFALTTLPGAAAPATTLQAIRTIARNPAFNVRRLFDISRLAAAYQPSLDLAHGPDAPDKLMRLDAFTLAVKVNATGRTDPGTGAELCPFGGLGNVAFDTDGSAWIANNTVQGTPNSTKCMVVLKPNGQPSDGSEGTPNSPVFGGGVLGQGFGVGFDPKGTVWSGNFGWGNLYPTTRDGQPGGSVSHFTRKGEPLSPPFGFTGKLYRVQGVVSDRKGNIWSAGFGNNTVQVFQNGEPVLLPAPFHRDENTIPFDVRLDKDDNAWVTYNGTQAVSKFALTQPAGQPASLQRLFTVSFGPATSTTHPERITGGPKGIALDTNGNAWIGIGEDDAVYAITRSGKPLGKFGGGGIMGPWGVALDADQTVWVANFGPLGPTDMKFRVSQLCGSIAGNCPAGLKPGDPISPATGYTLPSGGDQVRLRDGQPLYGASSRFGPSFDPLMRLTSVNVDMAGNVWCTNNWKPNWLNDITTNPGGDGMVIFVGLAAPVKPVLYSAPPTSIFAD